MAKEVDFRHTAPRHDPHDWQEQAARVITTTLDGSAVLRRDTTVWTCRRCHFVSELPPRFLRSDDEAMVNGCKVKVSA